MNMQVEYKTATPDEVQKIIHRARRLRSEYIAKSIKSGLSNLRGVFANKTPAASAMA
ncbi:RSP_7527 family protein [Roseivivax sp. CAU 1753]